MNDTLESVVRDRPFTVRRTIRWADCDPAGVVYAGHYADYLIDTVMHFMRHIGSAWWRGKTDPSASAFHASTWSLRFTRRFILMTLST